MPARDANGGSVAERLYPQIQRRLVENGEWDRMCHLLAQRLNESGWIDDLHHRAKELAKERYLSVRQLTEEVSRQSSSEVSEDIKLDVLAILRQYLDTQLEK